MIAISIGDFREVTPGVVEVDKEDKAALEKDRARRGSVKLIALHSLGYTTPAASGPGYWMFDGELLSDRRRRLEAEQFGDTKAGSS